MVAEDELFPQVKEKPKKSNRCESNRADLSNKKENRDCVKSIAIEGRDGKKDKKIID